MTDNKNNSGHWNSWHWNSWHWNSGWFNTGEAWLDEMITKSLRMELAEKAMSLMKIGDRNFAREYADRAYEMADAIIAAGGEGSEDESINQY